jgi:hypothetical protein
VEDMAAENKMFTEAKVNIAKNCIDRHLTKRGNSNHFEPNDPLRKLCIFPTMNCIRV